MLKVKELDSEVNTMLSTSTEVEMPTFACDEQTEGCNIRRTIRRFACRPVVSVFPSRVLRRCQPRRAGRLANLSSQQQRRRRNAVDDGSRGCPVCLHTSTDCSAPLPARAELAVRSPLVVETPAHQRACQAGSLSLGSLSAAPPRSIVAA